MFAKHLSKEKRKELDSLPIPSFLSLVLFPISFRYHATNLRKINKQGIFSDDSKFHGGDVASEI